MAALISCPRCGLPVESQALYCDHCGVDLALAAVLAEREVISPAAIPEGLPISPEILIPRMGDFLLEKGVVKPNELERALDYQRNQAQAGRPVLLGQALMELDLINRETLDSIITTQILHLQTALRDANRQLERRVKERTLDLQRALERLAELNQLKSNFIANISHELRTPLTHIKGYLDLLSEGSLGTISPAQGEALKVMQRAEVRLERLIEDLIQFSLAARGELNLKLSQVQLRPLIEIAISQSRMKALAAGVVISQRLPDTVPDVRADEDKISWVISQLLDNAIKFTPRAGHIEVQVKIESGLVTLVIRDTGIGIPPDRVGEIFEPFHQLDSSSTRHYDGTGLGLALVRRIVEAHGSEIRVFSIVGKGSRFEFSLPVAPVSAV